MQKYHSHKRTPTSKCIVLSHTLCYHSHESCCMSLLPVLLLSVYEVHNAVVSSLWCWVLFEKLDESCTDYFAIYLIADELEISVVS
jgi:hypothetical protein